VPEPIRLYLDEDAINRALIKALRSRNIDILTAQEAERMEASDQEHLDYATSLNRTVFTFNTRDFVKLHTEYLSANLHHAGIIVSDQAKLG
jgi:predicted nuclease of predicted toxin-antitoxin system